MFEGFAAFQFLRPLWLLVILTVPVLYIITQRRLSASYQWQGTIASHLLDHIRVRSGASSKLRPIHLISLTIIISALAMAGPTWQREPSPFTEDRAPLVIALDLSQTMDAIDIAPTRLERAKQKLIDLLQDRKGARTALIVYSGSAHMVLPFTEDPNLLTMYIESLNTRIMPEEGKEPRKALNLAESILRKSEIPGTILFFTDGISMMNVQDFSEYLQGNRNQIAVLAFGTKEGGPIKTGENRFLIQKGRRIIAPFDYEGLRALSSETGIRVISSTIDGSDLDKLQSSISTHLQASLAEDESLRWKEFGYYLIFPLALLVLLWFRKGWTVRWIPALFVGFLFSCSGQEKEFRFLDLWLTADQQGRYWYEQGDFEQATENFANPYWKGVAYYQAGNFDEAINWFARSDSALSYYNIGNCFAKLGKYEQALEYYKQALKMNSEWQEAQENSELVSSLIKKKKDEDPVDGPPQQPHFSADQIEFDNKADKGTEGEVELYMMSEEQIAEMWLRRLQTSPADFLRQKFIIQTIMQDEKANLEK